MRWLIAPLALCVLTSGCGDRPAAISGADSAGSELRRGNGGDPGSLDPSLAEDLHAYAVLGDLYEGLLAATADGGLAPGAAETWTVSPDGLEYRFRLRPDAAWSNGERVIAAHFVHGLRRALEPSSRSPNAFLLEPIANAAEVLRGESPPQSLGVRALGEDLLVIRLAHPARWLPTILTMPVAFPRLPGIHDDPASFTAPGRFTGNGPYLLESWRPGGEIRLRRNSRFHSAHDVKVDAVVYLPLADPAAELNLYRAGELDVTATVPPPHFDALRRERPCELQASPGLGLYYIAFDTTEPPLDDARLREALSLAIDRERLVRMLGRGEPAAYGLVPPSVASHVAAVPVWRHAGRTERESLARAALAASSYAGAGLSVELAYDAGDVHRLVALAVRDMWREVLGIEANLRQLEWKAFLDLRTDRASWQAMRFAWVGDYDDASNFTGIFASGAGNNLPGYSNARYDRLLSEAQSAASEEARKAALTSAERRLLADHPVAPLYFMTNKHLVAPRVGGFLPNALDRHPSRYLSVDRQSRGNAVADCAPPA